MSQYLRPLTSLRFFAALFIFSRHLFFWLDNPSLQPWYQVFLAEGYIGVTFFFVLSGFILTYNYKTFFTTLHWHNLRTFYQTRFARIYPVHALTFLLAISLPNPYPTPAWAPLAHLTLTQGFFLNEGVRFSFNGPAWALSLEALCYLLLPFILWQTSKINPGRTGLVAYCLYAAFVIWFRDVYNPATWWWFYGVPLISDTMLRSQAYGKHQT